MSARTLSDAMLHHPPSVLETEAVVLGSGPGGAITAAVLAENGYETLLLEAGGADEMTAVAVRGTNSVRVLTRTNRKSKR